MKRFILTLVALVTLLVSATALAAGAYRDAAAVEAAKQELPAACELIGYKHDDGKAEMTFLNNETMRYYEVDVSLLTKKVLEVEMKSTNIVGSTMVKLTPADIRAIVMDLYPDAVITEIKTDVEYLNTHYEVEFRTAKYRKAELKLNPVTGAIGKADFEYYR